MCHNVEMFFLEITIGGGPASNLGDQAWAGATLTVSASQLERWVFD